MRDTLRRVVKEKWPTTSRRGTFANVFPKYGIRSWRNESFFPRDAPDDRDSHTMDPNILIIHRSSLILFDQSNITFPDIDYKSRDQFDSQNQRSLTSHRRNHRNRVQLDARIVSQPYLRAPSTRSNAPRPAEFVRIRTVSGAGTVSLSRKKRT